MSSPTGVRHRGAKDKKRPTTPNPDAPIEHNDSLAAKVDNVVGKAQRQFHAPQGGEWDYKLAITIITVLAFVTRFWGINHPDQVVFDEVHFGKVCATSSSYTRNRHIAPQQSYLRHELHRG